MHRRPNFRLLARLGLRLEAARGACRTQRGAIIAPDVVVVGAGTLETVVIVCLESLAGAGVRLFGLGNCCAWWQISVSIIGRGRESYRSCRGSCTRVCLAPGA